MTNARKGYERLQVASDDFIARLGYVREGNVYRTEKPNDERIAAFCHCGFGMTWLSHLLRIPPNIFWVSFDITHTGVTVLEFRNRKCGWTVPKVLCLSDMSHIFADENVDFLYQSHMKI